jgi:hypothetical protein
MKMFFVILIQGFKKRESLGWTRLKHFWGKSEELVQNHIEIQNSVRFLEANKGKGEYYFEKEIEEKVTERRK